MSTANTSPLADLSAARVSVWLDDLSRQRIESGNLATLLETKEVVGVTSNPTIFASAFAEADHYAEDLDGLAARGAAVEDAIRELTTEDVRRACDVLHSVWQSTGGKDGRVSLEVDPGKAHDTEGTAAEAADLWKTVDRPNLMQARAGAGGAGEPVIDVGGSGRGRPRRAAGATRCSASNAHCLGSGVNFWAALAAPRPRAVMGLSVRWRSASAM